jgi:two-component system nitrate/nitrite response regulator NarL
MKVLIVDDHVLFAEAIQMAMVEEDLELIGIVSDPAEVEDRLVDPERRPDVILMDIGLPGESGLQVGARVVKVYPEIRVIALTALSDRKILEEAMRVGFSGFLTKDTHISRLVAAIRLVAEGEVIIPKKLARGMGTGFGSPEDRNAALLASQLTDRELQVLELLVEGASSEIIANRINVSRNTVRTHVQSILGKLGVHSRLEAAAFAVRHGLVSTRRPLSA